MRYLFAAVLLFAAALPAQIRLGEMGFEVQSPSGGTAGDACWGFDCTPRRLVARGGETLRLTVRAPLGAPYAVVFSWSATSCVRIPGIWNALVVDPPLIALFAGAIDRQNTTRFCYDGYAVQALAIPATLPFAPRFAMQAVAIVGTPPQPNTGWATSSAVAVVAR